MNKQQIQQIKEMRSQGKYYFEIAKHLGITKSKALYWGNEEYRKNQVEKAREKIRNLDAKERKKYYLKNKEYNKNYRRERYHSDEEFRKRMIEHSMKYKRKKSQLKKSGGKNEN